MGVHSFGESFFALVGVPERSEGHQRQTFFAQKPLPVISSCELDLRLSKFKSLENPELSVVGGQKVLQYVEFF